MNMLLLSIFQDADQVERLNESGELRQLLKLYKVCGVKVYSKIAQ